MQSSPIVRAAGVLAVLALGSLIPAAAGIDVDFGASVRIDDRSDLYFRISARYFDQDRATLARWSTSYRDPDDLAVAMFIHGHCGRSLDELYAWRHQRSMKWWDIGLRCGIPLDAWFVPARRSPGPPYGKAYGYRKKHQRNQARPVVLTDVEVRDLVALRMAHEYYAVPLDVAARWRSDGNLRDVMTEEYRRRHASRSVPSTQAIHD
jgi:hypothetical protein